MSRSSKWTFYLFANASNAIQECNKKKNISHPPLSLSVSFPLHRNSIDQREIFRWIFGDITIFYGLTIFANNCHLFPCLSSDSTLLAKQLCSSAIYFTSMLKSLFLSLTHPIAIKWSIAVQALNAIHTTRQYFCFVFYNICISSFLIICILSYSSDI